MRVLGIETSCDETAAAIVTRDHDGKPQILSNIVRGQIDLHSEYGGVVPEIAARAHLGLLPAAINQALQSSDTQLADIDGVAVTAGPGLAGGLLVGMMTAKALSTSLGTRFLAVNHLEGHALTARLTHDLQYPYLLLLVSGGHTQILMVRGLARYERIATTIDDAVGEAFDKTAKLLGLSYPGGPAVEAAAKHGNPNRFRLPLPLQGTGRLDFSLSGLKTAIRMEAERLQPLGEQDIFDLCASFQNTVCQMLADRVQRTIQLHAAEFAQVDFRAFVVAGGVAANNEIRNSLATVCRQMNFNLIAPPQQLCGDNAAMIAWAGLERIEHGLLSSLDEPPHPRWPLDPDSHPRIGQGKRGVKA